MFASNAQADTYVNGYFKKDGTYVSGHTRSSSSSKKSGSSHTLDLPANICKDGWESSSRGSGTCSHHGGIARTPLYYTPTQPHPQTRHDCVHDGVTCEQARYVLSDFLKNYPKYHQELGEKLLTQVLRMSTTEVKYHCGLTE